MTRHMRQLLMATALGVLSACGSMPPGQAPDASQGASVSDASDASETRRPQREGLSTAMLPSLDEGTTLKADTPLLQRPKTGSVVLTRMSAGAAITVLGSLDNADGRWVSVGFNDLQGWVRAAEIVRSP